MTLLDITVLVLVALSMLCVTASLVTAAPPPHARSLPRWLAGSVAVGLALSGSQWAALSLIHPLPPFSVPDATILAALAASTLVVVAGLAARTCLAGEGGIFACGAAFGLSLLPPAGLALSHAADGGTVIALVAGVAAASVLFAAAFHLVARARAGEARPGAPMAMISGLLAMPVLSMGLTLEGRADAMLSDPLVFIIACGSVVAAQVPRLLDAMSSRHSMRARGQAASLRGLLDCAGEGLVLCDAGAILFANRAFLALAGTSEDLLLARPFLSCLDDPDGSARRELSSSHPVQTVVKRPAGVGVPVEIRCGSVRLDGCLLECFIVEDLREAIRLGGRPSPVARGHAVTA